MKRSIREYFFLFVISGGIILLDQITKFIVRANLPVNGVWVPWDWLYPYARIYHTENTGVAFGMFQGGNVLFAILAMMVAAAIIYYFPRIPKADWTLRIALSMQLAGAVGNLIDRILIGNVTDFISVGNFAVFNVADSSITLGVVILLIGVWVQERKASAASAPAAPETVVTTDPASPIEKDQGALRIDNPNHE